MYAKTPRLLFVTSHKKKAPYTTRSTKPKFCYLLRMPTRITLIDFGAADWEVPPEHSD
ncbi:hypothetical protein PM082_019158 [Marasmius tenuissimus]|nr:hypothetical protein PM082_019158 [Marasmius tenuissimus]